MKVKATKLGFYNHKRQRAGAVFFLKSEKDFSEQWMEKLEAKSEKPKPKKRERSEKKATDLNQDVI